MIVTYQPQQPQPFKSLLILILFFAGLLFVGVAFKNPYAIQIHNSLQTYINPRYAPAPPARLPPANRIQPKLASAQRTQVSPQSAATAYPQHRHR